MLRWERMSENLRDFLKKGMMCLSDGSLEFITRDAGHRAGVRQLLACTDTATVGPLTNDPVEAASVLALGPLFTPSSTEIPCRPSHD